MSEAETLHRTSEGRFAPGQSGNPAGRPKGARNRGPTLRDVLNAGEELTMLRLMAEKALGGDTSCLKYCLDRLHARRRPVALDLLEGEEHDGESVHAAAMRAAAEGEITPEEAASLARLIAARQPVMKAHLVERRLAIADAIDAQHEAAEAEAAGDPPPHDTADAVDADSPSPLVGEGRGGGLRADEMPGGETPAVPMPGGNVPACIPLPDPPPQGGREKDEPVPPPVNSPVSQAPSPPVTIAGINRIYLEQEKLPKRPGTIRGFIRGRLVLP